MFSNPFVRLTYTHFCGFFHFSLSKTLRPIANGGLRGLKLEGGADCRIVGFNFLELPYQTYI